MQSSAVQYGPLSVLRTKSRCALSACSSCSLRCCRRRRRRHRRLRLLTPVALWPQFWNNIIQPTGQALRVVRYRPQRRLAKTCRRVPWLKHRWPARLKKISQLEIGGPCTENEEKERLSHRSSEEHFCQIPIFTSAPYPASRPAICISAFVKHAQQTEFHVLDSGVLDFSRSLEVVEKRASPTYLDLLLQRREAWPRNHNTTLRPMLCWRSLTHATSTLLQQKRLLPIYLLLE